MNFCCISIVLSKAAKAVHVWHDRNKTYYYDRISWRSTATAPFPQEDANCTAGTPRPGNHECHRPRRHTPSVWLYLSALEKAELAKVYTLPSAFQCPTFYFVFFLWIGNGEWTPPIKHCPPCPAPLRQVNSLFPRRHTGAPPARTAPTMAVGLNLRRQCSASSLSAPGGPERAAVRAGPGRDTGTHCGEMSKRTSLSSHSTSSTPLIAATRSGESARRPGNGVWGGAWVGSRAPAAAGIGCGAAREARAHSRPPWLLPRFVWGAKPEKPWRSR